MWTARGNTNYSHCRYVDTCIVDNIFTRYFVRYTNRSIQDTEQFSLFI